MGETKNPLLSLKLHLHALFAIWSPCAHRAFGWLGSGAVRPTWRFPTRRLVGRGCSCCRPSRGARGGGRWRREARPSSLRVKASSAPAMPTTPWPAPTHPQVPCRPVSRLSLPLWLPPPPPSMIASLQRMHRRPAPLARGRGPPRTSSARCAAAPPLVTPRPLAKTRPPKTCARADAAQICLCESSPAEAVRLSACEHEFCVDCISQYVQSRVSDGQVLGTQLVLCSVWAYAWAYATGVRDNTSLFPIEPHVDPGGCSCVVYVCARS